MARGMRAACRTLAAAVLLLAGPARAEEPPAPQGELTLRDAIAAALRGSPELDAFASEVRAREALALQAAALPNPELVFELEDFAGSGERQGFDSAQATLSLAQLVELG